MSNSCGVFAGGFVERIYKKIGIPEPKLTDTQKRLQICMKARYSGTVIGLLIGSVIGVSPLFLYNSNRTIEAQNHDQWHLSAVDEWYKLYSLQLDAWRSLVVCRYLLIRRSLSLSSVNLMCKNFGNLTRSL